jgi:hypothetical protein
MSFKTAALALLCLSSSVLALPIKREVPQGMGSVAKLADPPF